MQWQIVWIVVDAVDKACQIKNLKGHVAYQNRTGFVRIKSYISNLQDNGQDRINHHEHSSYQSSSNINKVAISCHFLMVH